MKDEEKRERICRELSGKESLEFGKVAERQGSQIIPSDTCWEK